MGWAKKTKKDPVTWIASCTVRLRHDGKIFVSGDDRVLGIWLRTKVEEDEKRKKKEKDDERNSASVDDGRRG